MGNDSMDKMATHEPVATKVFNETHEAARQAMLETLRPFAGEMSIIELVAVASQFLGQLVAMQDGRVYTLEQINDVVTKNIELGNQSIINEYLMNPQGSA